MEVNGVAEERKYSIEEILADVKSGIKREEDSVISEILGDREDYSDDASGDYAASLFGDAELISEDISEDMTDTGIGTLDFDIFDDEFEKTDKKRNEDDLKGETDEPEYDIEEPDNDLEYEFSDEVFEDGIPVITPDDMNGETDESEYDGEDPDNDLEYEFSDEAFEDGIPVLTPDDVVGSTDESEYDYDSAEESKSSSYPEDYIPGDIFEGRDIEIIPDNADENEGEAAEKESNPTFSFSESIFGSREEEPAFADDLTKETDKITAFETENDSEKSELCGGEAKSDITGIYDESADSVFSGSDFESDDEDEDDFIYGTDMPSVSDIDEDVTVYDGKSSERDFSFEKMYEEKKSEKDRNSKTRVFKKNDKDSSLPGEDGKNVSDDETVESEDELEKEFNEKRKEKIDRFRLFTENLEGDSYIEEEDEAVKMSELVKTKKGEDIFSAIEGVDKPKKDNSKRREKRKRRDSKVYDKIDVGRVKLTLSDWARNIRIRTIVTFICFVFCLVLGAAKTLFVGGRIQFLSGIFNDNSVFAYAAELVFGLPVLIVALNAFLRAVKNSEKFTLCREAVPLCVSLFNTIHNIILVLTNPEIENSSMFFGTAVCFIVLFELSGEKRENAMITKNLKTIVRNDNILGIFALENDNKNIASGISKSKEPSVLCTGEVEIPNSFLDSSLTKDKENMFFNIAVPVSVALSIVCGAIAYISYGTAIAFSCAALSALLVSSPVVISPVLVSLIARTNESLNRTGCEVLGYEDIENIDDTDAIVIDTADIFSGSISHFHLISRTVRIDTLHAFEIACSVISASGGVLKGEVNEFMKEQKLVLPEVEDIKYEEKLGLSCWVENKCVLLGTEKMMKEHNIEIPPEYSPEKYEREGSKVFYLAVDTHPTAMFCADYFIGRQAKKQLTDLYKTGVILMLMTTDPHIDEQFVANTLKVSASSIKTVNSNGAKQIRESIEKTTKQKRTGLIFRKSVIGFLKVINAAFRLYDAQSLTILIQIVSMVFAVVVSGALSIAATGYLPGVIFIIAYHAVWGVLGHFVTDRNKK